VVCSDRVARKRPTESNGTPTMDLGHMNVVLKWCICTLVAVVDLDTVSMSMSMIISIILCFFFPSFLSPSFVSCSFSILLEFIKRVHGLRWIC